MYPTYGDPNLKPEKGYVWTFGGNTKLNDKTDISASVFYSDIKDAIDWVWDGGTTTQAINVNKEKRRGLELSLNHDFDDNLLRMLLIPMYRLSRIKATALPRI